MELADCEKLAREKMSEHNLSDWHFYFDNSVRRFGHCSWHRRKISMSKNLVLLNSPERCLNTILHEIAHAIAGGKNGHNQIWVDTARSIGCDGQRCYTSDNTNVVLPKWQAFCSQCGMARGKYFRRKNLVHRICQYKYGNGKLIYKEIN